MRRKKSFLLLELLIGFFLMTLCLFPLIDLPNRAVRGAFASVWRMETNRLADLAFAECKTQLYTNTLPWKTIVQSSKEKIVLQQDTVFAQIPRTGKKKFLRSISLSSNGKKNDKGVMYYLLQFDIEFKPEGKQSVFKRRGGGKIYTYKVLVFTENSLKNSSSKNKE